MNFQKRLFDLLKEPRGYVSRQKLINIVLVGLVLVLLLREMACTGSGGAETPKADTVVVHDTSWQKYDSIVYKKLKIIETIHDTLPVEYYPHPMYDSLKVQYEELAQEFLAKNIYRDTFSIPQIKGTFIIKDTVKNNKLLGRSWTADYIIPTVTNTVTITKQPDPKRQFYVGGGLSANLSGIAMAQVGILYKDRRDKVFGAFVALAPNQPVSYGVQSYWKIRLKK
jgi:hypothetical protein